MSPQALTSRPFSTDSGGACPRLNGWRTRWEMGVGAAGHEDQAEQMSLVEGLSTPSGTRLLHLTELWSRRPPASARPSLPLSEAAATDVCDAHSAMRECVTGVDVLGDAPPQRLAM